LIRIIIEGSKMEYGYRGTPVTIDLGFDAHEGFHLYEIHWQDNFKKRGRFFCLKVYFFSKTRIPSSCILEVGRKKAFLRKQTTGNRKVPATPRVLSNSIIDKNRMVTGTFQEAISSLTFNL